MNEPSAAHSTSERTRPVRRHTFSELGRSFDFVARPYRFFEWICFGSALERARTAHIGRLADSRRVLILGEGDGRFLRRLCDEHPDLEIDVIDNSSRMVALARERVCSPNVTFALADARSHSFGGPYDAVVTAFFLDCFEDEQLIALLQRVTARCSADCSWLYADFHSGTTRWSRLRNGAWLWLLYRAFGAVTDIAARRLVDPLPALHGLGWDAVEVVWHRSRLLRSVYLRRSASAPIR